MDYALLDGRKAVLDMLGMMFAKLPVSEISELSEFFLLPLVARLIDEDDTSARKAVALVTKTLFTVVDDAHAESILTLTFGWLAQKAKPKVRQAAFQLLSIFAEASGSKFSKKYVSALPQVSDVLRTAAGSIPESPPDDWETVYFSLASLENVIAQGPAFASAPELNEVWPQVIALMSYPHVWVQLSCSRLVGSLLSRANAKDLADAIVENEEAEGEMEVDDEGGGGGGGGGEEEEGPRSIPVFLKSSENLVEMAKKMCELMTDGRGSAKVIEQATRNLVFIGRVFMECPYLSTPEIEEWEEGIVSGEKKKKYTGEIGEEHLAVHWLINKMTHVAKKGRSWQKLGVFKWFAAMATVMGGIDTEAIKPFLLPMVLPLYRSASKGSGGEAKKDVHGLSVEVLKLIRQTAGDTAYLRAYTEVRRVIHAEADKRERSERAMAVKDPRRYAKLKLRKSKAKKMKKGKMDWRTKVAAKQRKFGTAVRVTRGPRLRAKKSQSLDFF